MTNGEIESKKKEKTDRILKHKEEREQKREEEIKVKGRVTFALGSFHCTFVIR